MAVSITLATQAILETVIFMRALFVACDLNIAEHLARKPMSINEIAVVTKSNPKGIERLMGFLDMHGIFQRKEDGRYYVNDYSQTMRASHPNTIRPFLLHDDETRWNSFGHLGYSISTGNAAFDHLYGMSYFDYLKQHPKLNTQFNQAMAAISAHENDLIPQAIEFDNTVADIGGGTGHLINAIAKKYPTIKRIVFDLPEVLQQATLVHQNCTAVPGSFFDPIPVKADIFILKRILHDWDDERALKILSNTRNAMDQNSKLYIIEGILDYSKNKKLLAALDLALFTIFRGQERTKEQYEKLINQAGLELVTIQQLDDVLCIIECKKKN